MKSLILTTGKEGELNLLKSLVEKLGIKTHFVSDKEEKILDYIKLCLICG